MDLAVVRARAHLRGDGLYEDMSHHWAHHMTKKGDAVGRAIQQKRGHFAGVNRRAREW